MGSSYLRWLQKRVGSSICQPLTQFRRIQRRQQIRMLSAIILPYYIIIAIFIFGYIRIGTFLETVILLVLFGLMSISLYLSLTRHYWVGLGLFLATLVLNYLCFAILAQNRATIYSLTTIMMMSVFISSLFFSPRIVAYSAAGALLVIGLGVTFALQAPSFDDLILTVGMALFFFEIILFSSYIQRETNQLIDQQTAALIESERRFRSIFDQSFHIALFMRPDGFVIDANQKTQRLFQTYSEPVLGKYLWELSPWQHATRTVEQVQVDVQHATEGRAVHHEVTFSALASKHHTFDIWLRPVYDEAENVYLLVLMGHDITASKRHEQRRQLEATRYKALFDTMSDGVMIVDLDEHIMTINPKGADMLGYMPEAMQGMPLQDVIFGPGELNDVRRRMKQLIAGHDLTPNERVMKRKDGDTLPVEISPALMRSSDGSPLYVQVTFRDLTSRKRAERQEIELRLARERSQLLHAFVTSISHDLRTPLANIKTSTYLLGRLNGDKFEHHQGVINEAVDQLTEMIENQLATIQEDVPADDEHTSHFPIDVNQLVRDVVIGAQHSIQENKSQVNVALDTDVPMVLGDGGRLMVALRHLVANAVKFTPAGGQIKLRTTTSQDYVRVHIADTGAGIPQEELPRIFESLYQGDEARQSTGAGLGLTIANKIITAHGGTIEVQSKVGTGSEFIVSLPRAHAQAKKTTDAQPSLS